MTNVGLALLIAATVAAVIGGVGCALSRRPCSRSRMAALTIFGHGSLVSSGILLGASVLHVHGISPLSFHAHPLGEALVDLLRCDLEVSCALLTVGLITSLVLVSTFATTQGSARVLLRRVRRATDEGMTARLRPFVDDPDVEVLAVRDSGVDAFTVALLRRDRRRIVRAASVVVVTRGLVDLLTDGELRATIAHELSHVRARDDRYLPFMRTLSSLLFFDPVLRALHRRLARRHEFDADREAARRTRRPIDLARALLKVYLAAQPSARGAGFMGGSRSDLIARIEALLALQSASERPWPRPRSPS